MRILMAACLSAAALLGSSRLPRGIAFERGAANVVSIGERTAIYGIPARGRFAGRVFLTHARRDAISGNLEGAKIVVPAYERDLFENPSHFWAALETERFHDYAQQSTKIPVSVLRVERTVSEGDFLEEGTANIRVLSTPGFTRGAVSYLIEAGGKRIACTGDLIYGDGKLFDLYSLQDAVLEAKARGYHGYAARAVDLIASLRKVAATKPDVILPARGPAITDPEAAINRLVTRLQAFLSSHFETDALRWYWGEDNFRIRSRAVESAMDIMPMAELRKLPENLLAIGNSRLLISRGGKAFLVDAGYNKLLPELRKLRAEGKFESLEGIWITHYHDDHTDYVNDVLAEFPATVYFTAGMTDVLRAPGAYRLPCLTSRPIPVAGARRDGETLRWHEWLFTFLDFPGQTLYHGALIAKQDAGDTIVFAGDSFTPSGMDDYCMQNRDFLRAGEGYGRCLRTVAKLSGAWLINQHVETMFRYSESQVARMQSELTKRSASLKDLSPWPDINYMLDESWARIYPYFSEVKTNGAVELQLKVLNHAPGNETYRVKWNLPPGWSLIEGQKTIQLKGREEGSLRATVKAGTPGLAVITADVSFSGMELKQWTEALVRVN